MKVRFDQLSEHISLTERVYQIMRRMILNMELKPGERLKDYELAEKLGVSNTPVREALRRLEVESLIQTFPRKGTFVTKLTIDEVKGLYEVRETLEMLATRLFAERATDQMVDDLLKIAKSHSKAIEEEDIANVLDLDHRFHEIIAEGATNIILAATLQGYSDRIRIVRHMDIRKRQDESAGKEHVEIAKELSNRNGEKAALLMKDHIKVHSMRVIEMMEREINVETEA